MIAQAEVRCFQSSEHSCGIPRSRNWSFTFHVREELKAPAKNGLAQVPRQSEFPGKSREGFTSKDRRTPEWQRYPLQNHYVYLASW